jgi:hypothetical protein
VTSAIAIGVTTRTGSAVAVALTGTAAAPRFLARREIELVPPDLDAQPYHAAAGLDLAAGEELIARVEAAAERAAAAGLLALASAQPPGAQPPGAQPPGTQQAGTQQAGTLLAGTGPASAVRAVAVVVKPVSLPGHLAGILRSHAWMHAAEGVLYRQAVLAGATGCGWAAHAVEQSALPAAEQELAALGQVAGRPWRRLEKDAARAALSLLAAT